MRISRPLALLVGFVTALPVVYMGLFIASFFGESANSQQSMPVFGTFETMIIFHLLTMLLGLGLVIFYVVHAFKNPDLASDKRILWVLIIFMGSVFGMAAYWYVHIWQPSSASSAGTRRGVS
ncbi:MAG: hypothetical protein U0X73_05750 [Thermoanaerobaculia bacterium]